jgi:hypothetical protein
LDFNGLRRHFRPTGRPKGADASGGDPIVLQGLESSWISSSSAPEPALLFSGPHPKNYMLHLFLQYSSTDGGLSSYILIIQSYPRSTSTQLDDQIDNVITKSTIDSIPDLTPTHGSSFSDCQQYNVDSCRIIPCEACLVMDVVGSSRPAAAEIAASLRVSLIAPLRQRVFYREGQAESAKRPFLRSAGTFRLALLQLSPPQIV